MRLGFKDDDLQRLYQEQSFRIAKFGPDVTRAFRKKVGLLAAAASQHELRQFKSLRLEKLKGDLEGLHSIRLNDQWRLILRFETDAQGQFVIVIELVDYH